ncbi:single-stranded DNA-binding protein [Patescibacteria group bacterium]
MMRSVNKVILIGNLTRDPEMRQTANGQMVTTFCIATNREWVTQDSQKHGLAEYHDIVAWAKLAEICSKYLKKGKLVYIEGYLKTRSWDTPEGVKKFRTEVVAQDMIMLEKRPKGEEGEEYIPESDESAPPAEEAPKEEKAEDKPAEEVKEEPKEEAPKEEAPGKEEKEEKKEELDISADLGL